MSVMNKKYLGIIPARGGSKGIPKKNIKLLHGKPLIQYTIECANKAIKEGVLDRCIVSTDSEEIARISKDVGADVPFLRPAFLGGDNIKTVDVILHILNTLENDGEKYDAVVTLQPTSPLRTIDDLRKGIYLYDTSTNNSLISVYEDIKANGYNYYRMISGNIGLAEHKEHNIGIRRQEMRPMYVRNGALYISSINLLKQSHLIIGEKPLLYVMPKLFSTDIDSIDDFEYVEWIMNRKSNL